MNNKLLYSGLGGAGKSRLPTRFVKYKKKENTNHIIFLTDDKEKDDEQTRESDGKTFHADDSKRKQC